MKTTTVRRTTLLLIEDGNPDSAASADRVDALLQEAAPAAFDVVRASLADARSYLESRSPDCAVIDLRLPAEESLEVIKTLAAGCPTVALVVLMGSEDDELGVATIEAGASDYLNKYALEGKLLVRAIRHAILRKRSEASLAEAQSIARVGSWEVDLETTRTTWSRELYRMLRFGSDEQPSHEALLARTHREDRDRTLEAVMATVEHHSPFTVEHRVELPDGEVLWVRARGRVELDASGAPERLLGTVQDITEQKAADDALLHQALHDPLSGLPNRVLFLDRLTQALARLVDERSTVGVIYLDVDRFKVVNDSLGHTVGDELLSAMAARLQDLMGPGDTLARIGGDEFAVLCKGLASEKDAVRVADWLCAAMTEAFDWDGGGLVLSVSAGVAATSSAAYGAEALLRDADAAMYRAKSDGRARSAVFADTMRARAVGRLDTERALRQSIADGDLRVHYQPIVTLVDGQVQGHEALVRWEHPTRGLIGPDQFIAVAEETGLIVPLGAWVLREACMEARRLQNRDPRWQQLSMSVNLSGGQLGQTDLLELVASALQDAQLDPEYLQLEMTESVLMDDAASTITILEDLKGLGVRLGIDDFGTGYSSLSYLRRFPVDVLKIDRSFVDGLGVDLEDSAIVAAVVSLADTLGLLTIAEGVETERQRASLVGLGCTRAQGYLFARPAAVPAAAAALDQIANRNGSGAGPKYVERP